MHHHHKHISPHAPFLSRHLVTNLIPHHTVYLRRNQTNSDVKSEAELSESLALLNVFRLQCYYGG